MNAATLTLRPAADADCERLWTWANDPVARTASFRSRPIEWDEHVSWFRARREDPSSRIYVVEESGDAVGVVRFELDGSGDAVVSVNVAPSARGRGLGPRALRQACALVADDEAVATVTAYIKPENTASLRAFDQAGFACTGPGAIEGTEAVVMTWSAGSAA